MHRTWHVLSTYWFGKMVQLYRIAHICKVMCVRVWDWSIQTQSGKQIVFPVRRKGRLIIRVPSVSISVKEHELSNSSNAELAINVLCKLSFLVPDYSSLNSNAFVCYQLLSAKHFANIQITCLLLNELVVNQLQQHLVPSIQHTGGRELAFSVRSKRKTLTLAELSAGDATGAATCSDTRTNCLDTCVWRLCWELSHWAVMYSVCPASKCFVSGQACGVGRPFKLCSRYVLLVYFSREWKSCFTLLQYSACFQCWEGQAPGAVITGCKEKQSIVCWVSSVVILSQCLRSGTAPLLH